MIRDTYWFLSVLLVITSANAKIRCLEGVRLTSPLDTTIVTECGDHEICSVERYVTNDGIILYNVGCKDRQYCIANPLGKLGVGKRAETVICRHCCEDKDLCNMNQCGARVNLPVGSTICYKCPLAMDANKCNHITLCDRDSACSIKQTRNLLGEPRWMHGCSQKSQCSTIAHINPQGICSFCCDTELCNRNCTIKSTVATPPSTPTTATTTMAPTTPIRHAKIRCLEGVRLTSPLDTTIVTECGDHEVCAVERYVTNDGIIFYNVGCKDRQLCIANPLGPGKGDETFICRHCCDDKDLCNMNQCGARVNLPVGSTICYSCPLAMDANKCNHITLCDRDSACSIKQTQNLIGKPRWSHGCSEKTQCATIAQSNPQGICSFCCDTELCNRNCTIRSTIAPPPTTTTTTMAPTTPITRTIKSLKAPPPTATTITTTIMAPTTPIPSKYHQINNSSSYNHNYYKYGANNAYSSLVVFEIVHQRYQAVRFVTAPIITQTVIQPTNIKYGDTVTIQCIATGNPKPAIDFLVKGRRLGANVHVDPTTHLLTISNFSPYDVRDYRCIASNLLGDVHKDIHIQGHT
ncbi:uncharacterized protein [Mytilus edulis]|uniref:uncharacterized protein n=1 Tax=Mytilus edulis TaxID=6550 RepID=UPI0039F0C7A2